MDMKARFFIFNTCFLFFCSHCYKSLVFSFIGYRNFSSVFKLVHVFNSSQKVVYHCNFIVRYLEFQIALSKKFSNDIKNMLEILPTTSENSVY